MTIKEKEKEKKSEKRFKLGYFLLSKNLINIQRFLSENYYSGHRGRDSSSRGKKRRGRFPRDVPHVQRTFSYLFFLFSFLYYFHALYNQYFAMQDITVCTSIHIAHPVPCCNYFFFFLFFPFIYKFPFGPRRTSTNFRNRQVSFWTIKIFFHHLHG